MKKTFVYVVTETRMTCNDDGEYTIVYRRMLCAYDTIVKARARIKFDTDAYRPKAFDLNLDLNTGEPINDFTVTDMADNIIEVKNNHTGTKRVFDVVIMEVR